jgi:hypothetical protein
MKIRMVLGIALPLLLGGCGPKKTLSYKADDKIREDYLKDSVRVRFSVVPECRQIFWFYLYWTEKCKEPYTIQVSVAAKLRGKDPGLIHYQSLILSMQNRNYQLLNHHDSTTAVSMDPQPDGTSTNLLTAGLGKLVASGKPVKFKLSLLYRLNGQIENSLVEKEFESFAERRFRSVFTGK